MLTIESPLNRFFYGELLTVLSQHPRPGDALKRKPMPTKTAHQRREAEKKSENSEKTATGHMSERKDITPLTAWVDILGLVSHSAPCVHWRPTRFPYSLEGLTEINVPSEHVTRNTMGRQQT